MQAHPQFSEIGKRLLLSWQEGVADLRDKRTYSLSESTLGEAFAGFSDPEPVTAERTVIGRAELVGRKC